MGQNFRLYWEWGEFGGASKAPGSDPNERLEISPWKSDHAKESRAKRACLVDGMSGLRAAIWRKELFRYRLTTPPPQQCAYDVTIMYHSGEGGGIPGRITKMAWLFAKKKKNQSHWNKDGLRGILKKEEESGILIWSCPLWLKDK